MDSGRHHFSFEAFAEEKSIRVLVKVLEDLEPLARAAVGHPSLVRILISWRPGMPQSSYSSIAEAIHAIEDVPDESVVGFYIEVMADNEGESPPRVELEVTDLHRYQLETLFIRERSSRDLRDSIDSRTSGDGLRWPPRGIFGNADGSTIEDELAMDEETPEERRGLAQWLNANPGPVALIGIVAPIVVAVATLLITGSD